MLKIVMTFGLLAGAVLSGMLLLTFPFMDQIGFDKGAIIGYTSMVAGFLLIYFGVRSYRDTSLGGSIRFWPAFGVGIAIMLVASVCYTAAWQTVYTPAFTEKMTEHEVEKARLSGASPAVIEATRRDMVAFGEMYKNPLVRIGFTMLEPTPVGVLMSLISAFRLSRKRRDGVSSLSTAVS